MYRLNSETALVLTVDFFPPIVDDPFLFGTIAAANSLSDVYAMGGRPLAALNIAAFPADLPSEILAQILAGGSQKAAEAGVPVLGGHTIDDAEPKFGMAVTGLVHPDEVVTNDDLAKVVEQSRDNPVFYVQYSHARCCSVLRHAAEMF